MRLRGSLTEERMREGLARFRDALRDGPADDPLASFLRSRGVDLATAFVLDCIPEQGEDIWTVLDGDRRVLVVELPRGDGDAPPSVEETPIADYRRAVSRRSRLVRLRFAVAEDLVSRGSRSE